MLVSLSQCQELLGKDVLTLFYANQPSEESMGPSTWPGPQLTVAKSLGLMRVGRI